MYDSDFAMLRVASNMLPQLDHCSIPNNIVAGNSCWQQCCLVYVGLKMTQQFSAINNASNIIASLLSMLGYHNAKVWSCRQVSISNSAARQLIVYTKNTSRKCYMYVNSKYNTIRSLLCGVVLCLTLDKQPAVEVSKSWHNSTIKPLIQNSPTLFSR